VPASGADRLTGWRRLHRQHLAVALRTIRSISGRQ